ncbi:MAG: hypothetical protein EOP24_26790 [Hyphomicrobiales bacterium]|nr:MAG: hypothetical protein EOP24_26790 [Hyphomicrobiales bacterium]
MTTNLYTRLLGLLPQAPVMTGTVAELHGDGTASVQLHGGGLLRVRNPFETEQGAAVFVQDDAVIGDAPSLPLVLIEI